MNKSAHFKMIAKKAAQFASLFLIILVAFIIYTAVGFQTDSFVRPVVFAVLLVVFSGIYFARKGSLTDRFTRVCMCGGMLVKILFMLQNTYALRAHDLDIVSLYGGGHAGYILRMLNGVLPESNVLQFYQPPFFYWLSAQLLKLYRLVCPTLSMEKLFEITKLVSCFASCVTLVLIKKICEELEISKKAQIIVLLLTAFYPNHFLLAARVNNDALAVMFMMMILLYSVRWYKKRTIGNILGIALGFGFGMMTKMNVATMAFLVGPMFLIVLVRQIKAGEYKKYLLQYTGFLAVSVPLGMWYPIRNLIRFHQPFDYVLKIGSDSFLYRGHYSFLERFVPDLHSLLETPFVNTREDVNAAAYLIRTSLFGEFRMNGANGVVSAILVINVILLLIMLAAAFLVLFGKKWEKQKIKWWLALYGLLLVGSYLWFNVKYPFACSMDYRYIVPISFVGALFLALLADKLFVCKQIKERAVVYFIYVISGAFSLASVYLYCVA